MHGVSESMLTRFCNPAVALRAGCVALFVCVSGCGGGAGGSDAGASATAAPDPAPSPTEPPQLPAWVVGPALSIDDGASGNPVDLRVVRSANGDGFAVWQADDGTRRNLWANRYRAAVSMWGPAINIEATDADIDEFDLTVDASGNAAVVWHEGPVGSGMVMSTRFDTATGAWGEPVLLKTGQGSPRVASDATGAVLGVYGIGNGRLFDPVSGIWQPEAAIAQWTFGTGHSDRPVPLLDGSGNALVVYHYQRTGAAILASNYYSRDGGGWGELPPDADNDILGDVPASFIFGFNENVQLATSAGGDFLAAWQAIDETSPAALLGSIRVARFTSSARTWTAAQTLVSVNAQNDVRLQRLGSDASGNALLLWTESDGMRTALKALRLDHAGLACDAVRVIDRAVGGGAARADLGVDAQGNAIAVWQQFEGGRPDDGSRSNIAVSRFDRITGAWSKAMLVESQPGNAIQPRASAGGGQALLGWIQSEGSALRVKASLQPLGNPPNQ